MPTTTKTIKPGGGGDYTTLALALANNSTNTNDLVFNCYKGDITAGISVTIDLTAPASITLNAVDRHSGVPVADLSQVSGCVAALLMSTSVPTALTGLLSSSLIIYLSGQSHTVDQMVFQAEGSGGCQMSGQDEPVSTLVTNSAFYNDAVCGVLAGSFNNSTNHATMIAKNCSMSETGYFFAEASAGASTTATAVLNAINCASMAGSTNNGVGGFVEFKDNGGGTENATVNLTNCCYQLKQTTGTNTAPQVSTPAAVYVSSTNYASKDASSKLRDNGTNDGLTFDIIGVTRPQNGTYDIGAFEFPVAAPSTSTYLGIYGTILYGG